MLHVYANDRVHPVGSEKPNQVQSSISIRDLSGQVVRASVVVDIEHSDNRDLTLKLFPNISEPITLRDRVRGPARNQRFYIPEDKLKNWGNGSFRLLVQDRRARDGGRLNWWRLELETVNPSSFNIEVDFKGGLTKSQQKVFEKAGARWSEVIRGDLPEAKIGSRTIDDVLIYAEGRKIDGPGTILGQAGPTHLRSKSFLPIAGSMSFDSDDLAAMEANGSLLPVIVHEMGHVLGIGTLWRIKGFVHDSGGPDPRFTGPSAVEVWKGEARFHDGDPGAGVPLANTGGPGTREGHWRESTFGNELMTGYINSGFNPLSRLTIASLADLGYQVDMDAADALVRESALMGLGMASSRPCCPARFEPIIVEA